MTNWLLDVRNSGKSSDPLLLIFPGYIKKTCETMRQHYEQKHLKITPISLIAITVRLNWGTQLGTNRASKVSPHLSIIGTTSKRMPHLPSLLNPAIKILPNFAV